MEGCKPTKKIGMEIILLSYIGMQINGFAHAFMVGDLFNMLACTRIDIAYVTL